jgi:hypothetical protein
VANPEGVGQADELIVYSLIERGFSNAQARAVLGVMIDAARKDPEEWQRLNKMRIAALEGQVALLRELLEDTEPPEPEP